MLRIGTVIMLPAVALAVALVGGVTERAAAEGQIEEPLDLSDVLSRDPRDSPAGCPNVDYGTAAEGDAARTVDFACVAWSTF